jgi:hypothetical protein
MTATSLLTHQHGHLLALIQNLERGTRDARVLLLLELVDELTAHLAIAAYFVYGAARDATGIPLDPYHRSQATLKSALKQLLHAEADDETFRMNLAFLKQVLAAHVLAEEGELFPATERAMKPAALDAIGTRMEAFCASMKRT